MSHRSGYLQLLLLLVHNGADDVKRGVGEAEHEQQGQLVLDGKEEEVVDVRRVGEALHHHCDVLQQAGGAGVGVVLHDGSVHRVLHRQETFSDIACTTKATRGNRDGSGFWREVLAEGETQLLWERSLGKKNRKQEELLGKVK